MTNEQELLLQVIGYDDDTHLMNCAWEIDLKIEELKKGYYQKYFRTDLKRPWGFKCHDCGEKVQVIKMNSIMLLQSLGKIQIKWGDAFVQKNVQMSSSMNLWKGC